MLFTQTALKANRIRSFLLISATGGHNDRTDFAAVESWLFCNYHCFCKNKTLGAAASSIYKITFCPSKQHGAEQCSGAELTISWKRMSDMKVDIFSFSLTHLQVLFCVFKEYPNTINTLLLIRTVL